MASTIPYDTSSDALLHPAKNAVFFKDWNPDVDNRNHNLLCAEMSRLAYAPEEVIRGSLKGIGFTALEPIGGEGLKERGTLRGTQGFVARHPSLKLTVLAFRGTESDKFEDLIADLNTLVQKEWPNSPGCLAHTGFADCWDPVSKRVTSLVARREGTLLVTGHSLGAALATLAAIVVKPTKLITFGSPRVGNDKLCALLTGVEVRRFVHCCDLITRIPPERFDKKRLGELLSELANPGPHDVAEQLLVQGAATALAVAFRGLRLDPHFEHVAFAQYADRNGKILGNVKDAARLQDQEAARRAYKKPASHGQLGERLRELTARVTATHGDALEAFRSFTGHLFASNGASVALRDMADHAPINYVSLFTGRS